MSEFKPERGVPVPEAHHGKGYTAAVLALKPGESVLLPTTYASGRAIAASLYGSGRRKRGSMVVREDPRGVRVWYRPKIDD